VVLALVPNVTASDVDTLYQKQVRASWPHHPCGVVPFSPQGRPSVQQAPACTFTVLRLTLALPVVQVKGMEQMGKAEAKGKEVGQAVVTERSADHAKPPANPVNRTGVWPKFPHVTYIYIHKVYICIHQGRRSGP
jgi:hypothetical protein